jgi:pimeloyl-ACP methyl ester carboxylesterase
MKHVPPSRALAAAILLGAASAASAAPCTRAAPECTEWLTLGGGPARSLLYRNLPLQTPNREVTRALVVVHGAGRDADNYFLTAAAAAFLAQALEDTIVISPRFASLDGSCKDALGENEVSWPCGGNSWRAGGPSTNHPRLTSFDFMDEILRRLSRKDVFPNMKSIVLTGHSAGGQFVSRYQMANKVHEGLGLPVTYVISNPSSYAYLDPERPTDDGKELRPLADASKCENYDRWPYGLQSRGGYTASISDDQLRKQLVARPAVLLLGGLDTLPLAGFDSSCSAMAQGPNRLARGQAYASYVGRRYGAPHKLVVIPLCGHNGRCMFNDRQALEILFARP